MFYTAVVEKPKLNDDEIATIMWHEMVHALKEHAKVKIRTADSDELGREYRQRYSGFQGRCRSALGRLGCGAVG